MLASALFVKGEHGLALLSPCGSRLMLGVKLPAISRGLNMDFIAILFKAIPNAYRSFAPRTSRVHTDEHHRATRRYGPMLDRAISLHAHRPTGMDLLILAGLQARW